jgi:hypothetical protein
LLAPRGASILPGRGLAGAPGATPFALFSGRRHVAPKMTD